MGMNKIDINDIVSQNDILAQLAEECCELAQASLKLIRGPQGGGGTNPTRKTLLELTRDFLEEVADVQVCLEELYPYQDGKDLITLFRRDKRKRWIESEIERNNR
jgi:NTP pyrophosphatase (non-canonical NTP hydrolase)